jgi:hypothetical protein
MLENMGLRIARLAARLVLDPADFSTGVDQALFYSGATNFFSGKLGEERISTIKNWALADDMTAQNVHLTTIGQTRGGRTLDRLLKSAGAEKIQEKMNKVFWNYASREFAQRASGTVTIFCDGSKLDSTFRMVEAFEIINNSKITHVRLLRYEGADVPYSMQIGTKDLLRKYVMGEELIGERAFLTPRDELRTQFKLRGEDSCLTRVARDGMLKTLSDGVAKICASVVVSVSKIAPHTPA